MCSDDINQNKRRVLLLLSCVAMPCLMLFRVVNRVAFRLDPPLPIKLFISLIDPENIDLKNAI